jgi:tRNA-splicing ligase RtcB (3'-phosphate/5'-hydroxy nucleic acid ligase)
VIRKQDLERISQVVWQVPKEFRSDMRAPARIYADEALLEDALEDKSVEQLVNTATLPGVVRYAIAMPDVHQGYGAPVGGVFATQMPDGVISPGAIGYDINCGVRLLASHLRVEEIAPQIKDLASALYRNCPSGVGSEGSVPLNHHQLDEVLENGSEWAAKGSWYARRADLERTEERGRLAKADAALVSKRAKERGKAQLGTLGAGNHFIELDRVAQVYDGQIADRLGLFPEQIVVQIHCGSRGLGHQVCTDYVDSFQQAARDYGIQLPDRELVCAPFESVPGQNYFKAMACAANYAFANRQMLAYHIRRSFEETLAGVVKDFDLDQVYDIAHNMGKVEEHDIDGRQVQVCVHRKGATRAFGPGTSGLPLDLIDIGQPVLIPGSMGTASYVLIGTAGSMAQTFGSTCHGAGRVMSRSQAKKQVRGDQLQAELNGRGIIVRAGSMPGLAEEAPQAYKDVSRVVEVVCTAGIAARVARLEPLAVIKG